MSNRSSRVLVVDDEPQIVRALRSGLRASGYEVLSAFDGEGALTSITKDAPDVMILDLGMSPMDTIRAATYWPSVMMKVDMDVGTVSEGKYADIIAVKGDVLRYINLLQRVDLVMKHGVRVK